MVHTSGINAPPCQSQTLGVGPGHLVHPALHPILTVLKFAIHHQNEYTSSIKCQIKYGRVRVLKCGPPMNSPLKYISNITASYVFAYLHVLGYLTNFIYIIFVRKGSVHFNLLILLHV